MNISDFRNVEIIKNSISNRGNIVELPPGKHIYELDYYSKDVINGFNSVFYHQDRVKEFFKDTSDRKPSYDGSVYSNYLIWDFDNKENVGAARLDTIELIERLMAYTPTNISAYFSGGKGFHVVYVCPELDQVKVDTYEHVVKNVCLDLAKGLKSLDYRIYDKMRVIRTPNSRHGSTKLFKVPVSYNQLKDMTVDEILKYAESQHQHKISPDMTINEDLLNLIKDNLEVKEVRKAKTSLPELVEGIYNGFRENHNRNDGLTSLCGLLHSRGVPDDIVRALVSITNERNKVPLPESEVNTICNSVSRYHNSDVKVVPVDKDIVTMEDAANAWYTIRTNNNEISFGNRFIHLSKRLNIAIPGDVIAIVASSGVGKTGLALDICNNEAKEKGMYGLFASLEMSKAGLFFRAATMESPELTIDHRVPTSEVTSELLKPMSSLKEKVLREWNNLLIIDKGGISIEAIVKYFHLAQEMTEGKISNLVIDYTQNLDKAEDVKYSMTLARELKDVAKELNTLLFPLMQTNKEYRNEYARVEKHHIEGVGAFYQACDFILTFWKSSDEINRLHAELLKDRWNGTGYMFDIIRTGLKYHTETYKPDVNNTGGL